MNFIFRNILFVFFFLLFSKYYSQNSGELIGYNKHSISQNYKLPSFNTQKFEGLSSKQIKSQELENKNNQEEAKKELLKSHLLKQDKPTRKRMKKTLKKSQRFLAKKTMLSHKKVLKQRKIVLSQRKINKAEE